MFYRFYHFVFDPKNLTEAQRCTDTVDNMEDVIILIDMVDLCKFKSLPKHMEVISQIFSVILSVSYDQKQFN